MAEKKQVAAGKKQVAREILDRLLIIHPQPVCELNFDTPFELLVAVILSAQCTDKRVNEVTKELFKKYRTPEDFANIDVHELERLIFSCGFYRNKAANIIKAATDVLVRFDGKVPSTVEELVTLAGVGRKTANVVYAVAFGGQAIAVDTHVLRVSNRIGFVKTDKPEVVEKALTEAFPKERWAQAHHLLIHHGRYICKARNPECDKCNICEFCNYYKEISGR